MIDHIAKEAARVTHHAQHGQGPQHGIDDDIEPEQKTGNAIHAQQVGRERHDAGRHHHAEIRG